MLPVGIWDIVETVGAKQKAKKKRKDIVQGRKQDIRNVEMYNRQTALPLFITNSFNTISVTSVYCATMGKTDSLV